MLYLSQVLGRPILDARGEKIASINDVLVRYGSEDYPPVIGIVARLRRRNFFIPQRNLAEFGEFGARMSSAKLNLTPFERREGEVLLGKDVLDNQLIDVDGKRVVRVNDVQIIPAGDTWRVSGADVSFQGFLRRLMPKGFYGSSRVVEVLDWSDVGYLATDTATATVQLKSSKDKLSRLHPVEIAQLAETLSPIHRTEVVESLDNEFAADTLEEMSTEAQARILEEMDEERAADILEEMSPDDAADVLGELSDEKAQELFDLMEDDEKADVAELMHFEHDTAGGLMTTEFVVFPKDLTVGQAIARLREMAETPNMIYYLYIVEEEGSWKICGLISLRSLILAEPTFKLEEVMRTQFRFAHTSDSAEDVAQTISEYNLLALPVIDDEGDIAGIVTVDDAMEVLLPKGLQRRIPKVFG
ncbi:MAG: magnesium transporter [Blastocatellia bacterium]|nr:magnesium transporter [Chloracidobacterium sp.]MBL8186264.1 magnesium transporter [Blastocatellia bacterium]HRJ88768.1 CBS domain-containing protein [Pyrinomonadaceae bacterium]HRK48808.1 CBS domain-containing protein [Pyrinomonadaceae bacterium]